MAPEEASPAEAVGPGAGNLGRRRLSSVACPEGIMAPAFPTGSGMASGGGQPREDLLLQGTASPTGTLGSRWKPEELSPLCAVFLIPSTVYKIMQALLSLPAQKTRQKPQLRVLLPLSFLQQFSLFC